jgi:hypothetical protein
MLQLPVYTDLEAATLRSHLHLVHGIYVRDIRSAHGLVECHESDHAENFGRNIRHEHVDTDLDELPDEWEW